MIIGSDLARVDATTEAEIARHMLEDDTPEWTDAQFAEAVKAGRRPPWTGMRKRRLHRKARHRQHLPLRQLLIRHQTATLRRGWR